MAVPDSRITATAHGKKDCAHISFSANYEQRTPNEQPPEDWTHHHPDIQNGRSTLPPLDPPSVPLDGSTTLSDRIININNHLNIEKYAINSQLLPLQSVQRQEALSLGQIQTATATATATTLSSAIGNEKNSPGSDDSAKDRVIKLTSSSQFGAAVVPTPTASTTPTSTSTPVTPVRGNGRGRRGSLRGRGRPPSRPALGRGKNTTGGTRGKKRKRGFDDDDEDENGAASSSSVDDEETLRQRSVAAVVTTKSGRSITKPSQFAAEEASPSSAKKRRRGPSQILCTKCARGHFTPANAIVLCDGCNAPWHQWCHDPMIPKELITDIEAPWFCGKCEHAREMKSVSLEDRVSGASLSLQEKEEYLSSLSRQTLISLLMHATAKNPDLPLFARPGSSKAPRKVRKAERHARGSGESSNNKDGEEARSSIPTPPTSQPPPLLSPVQLGSASADAAARVAGEADFAAKVEHADADAEDRGIEEEEEEEGEEDPYPDFNDPYYRNPPSTFPYPGRGPIPVRPLTDPIDIAWMVDPDYQEGFSHLVDDGNGDYVPVQTMKDWVGHLAKEVPASLVFSSGAAAATAATVHTSNGNDNGDVAAARAEDTGESAGKSKSTKKRKRS